ncbi:hypothetical protein [Azospirillum palustre]
MLRPVITEAGTAVVMDEDYPLAELSPGAVREIRAVTDLQLPRRSYLDAFLAGISVGVQAAPTS